MSTYTQILYHIIFSTKRRISCIQEKHEEQLFRYIWGIIENKNCKLYQINGSKDHLHLAVSLHPSVSLSDLVKTIKVSSSLFIKENKLFVQFPGWQEGYGAFTVSWDAKEQLVSYIKGQKEHHRTISFLEEYRSLMEAHHVKVNEKYFP